MIAIEIRNDEMRAVKFKKGISSKKIDAVGSVDITFEEISGLATGKILPLVDKVTDLLYKLEVGNITKEEYILSINLEGVSTQQILIPKVKESQILFSARSALARDNILVEEDKLISFAIQKELKSKKEDEDKDETERRRGHNLLTHVVDKHIVKSIYSTFEHLELNVKYIDIAPNTLVKLYKNSSFVETGKELTLIVDLSREDMRYYQIKDNDFHFNYLERIGYDEEDYLDVFQNNVFQFIDEFSQYTLDNLEVVLMGDSDLIKEVMMNFNETFNMHEFTDALDVFQNKNDLDLSKYMNSLGSSIRNDKLFSSQAKYDINLLKDIKDKKGNNGLIKNIVIVGSIALLLGGSYLTFVKVTNIKLDKENEAILRFVNDPETLAQIDKKERLTSDHLVYDNALDVLLNIEDYLKITKPPYSSRTYYSIIQSSPSSGWVNTLTQTGTKNEISYETTTENTFKEYLLILSENPLIRKVEYNGYSSGGEGYVGNIAIELKESGR